MPDFDLVVIGGGAAGLSAATYHAALGLRVALVERDRMGGTSLHHGSIPLQALRAAARSATAARQAGRFGLRLPPPEIDWQGVRAHLRGAIARLAPNAAEARLRGIGVEVVRAAAHFVAPDMIEAAGRRLSFRRCLIAAGSQPVVPDIPGLGPVPWLTSETIFDLEEPPGHLIILGGGATGLELAQAHARLGCLVTVIEPGRIAAREDPELVDGLRRALLRDGVTVLEDTGIARIIADRPVEGGPGLVAELEDGSQIGGTHLLLALGRAPRLAGLDLIAGQVTATEQGIATDAGLRSVSNRRVFAAGDIADPRDTGPRGHTHVAVQHAALLLRRIAFRLPGRLDLAATPRAIQADPELVQIGLTEAEARTAGHAIQLLRFPLAETDRAVAEGIGEGLVKLVVTPRGRLLGAGILAPRAGEMAGILGLMIARRLPLSALAGLALPYPSLAEAAQRAAAEFYMPRLLSPMLRRAVGLLRRLP